MITRSSVAEAVATALDELGDKATVDPLVTGGLVADRLGLVQEAVRHSALGRMLFVRQIDQIPVEVAARFDVVIVAVRNRRGAMNRHVAWYEEVRRRHTRIVAMDWLPMPGQWAPGLEPAIKFARVIGAVAWCADLEPPHWNGEHGEARAYVADARFLCDRRNMEFWFTGVALPKNFRRFPWLELIPRAAVSICQPYDRDHRLDPDYPERSAAQYRELGAKVVVIGRGAHRRDDPSTPKKEGTWRTPQEITEHRATTPVGADTAWWVPSGRIREDRLDAMCAPTSIPLS